MRSRGWYAGSFAVAAMAAALLVGCEAKVDLGPIANRKSADTLRKSFTSGATAGVEKTAAKSTGTGWATIRGQFVYDGNPPDPKPYDVNKEPGVCLVDGKAPPQETLVVDPGTKGVKNVVVFLRNASRVHDSAAPKKDKVEFDQKHCVFLTHVAAVTVGQTVDIKNSDTIGHNTNIVGTGFNPTVAAGGSVPYPVQKEINVPNEVKCGIHPWMTAYLLQRKNGYFAVTDANGNFEIANVPAGEPLEFQVWHESGAAKDHGLVGTAADAKDIKWTNRGRITMTLQPDEKKEIKVVVPSKAFSG